MKLQYVLRIVLPGLAVMIAACAGSIPAENRPLETENLGPATVNTPVMETDRISPDQAPVETPEAQPDSQASELAATPVLKAVASTRTGFVASDPGDFHLASGEVQLVEFFAFW